MSMHSAEKQIAAVIENAFHSAVAGGEFVPCELPEFQTRVPADRTRGDYTANAAFVLAKPQSKTPHEIAGILAKYISLEDSCFECFETAGTGFLNFTLGSAYYAAVLLEVMKERDAYGYAKKTGRRSQSVEFVSADKTLFTRLRSAAVEDSMKNILEAAACGVGVAPHGTIGAVRLIGDGEAAASELSDDISASVRFFFNDREPAMPLYLDLGLAAEQSSLNPCYYCRHVCARIDAVFIKSNADGIAVSEASFEELLLLKTDAEKALITHIAALAGEIEKAAKEYNPVRVTRYAVGLASRFYKFCNAQRILGGDEGLMRARLSLCDCTRIVMKNVLTLLKIDVPEKM